MLLRSIKPQAPIELSGSSRTSRLPPLREAPQHGKHPIRDNFLECRTIGRHALYSHDGGGYLSRSERSRCGPRSVLRKPGKFIVRKVPRAPVSSLGRDGIGICARRKEAYPRIYVCEIRTLTRGSFFKVVNMAADFSALEAKGGNYVSIGHAPNLGADPIHFLWQLRHNTAKSGCFSL
jgi:hypothetical protein